MAEKRSPGGSSLRYSLSPLVSRRSGSGSASSRSDDGASSRRDAERESPLRHEECRHDHVVDDQPGEYGPERERDEHQSDDHAVAGVARDHHRQRRERQHEETEVDAVLPPEALRDRHSEFERSALVARFHVSSVVGLWYKF